MDLDELQSVRDRERQTDKLQQLRESFYADAGEFIQQLRRERERAAERADDPFDSPEVNRLTDEINTAEGTVEAIFERRIGKIVKAASLAAADQPLDAEGMTAEETVLFDDLVDDIVATRQRVFDTLDGEPTGDPDPASGSGERAPEPGGDPVEDTDPARTPDEPAGGAGTTDRDADGVAAADLMGDGTGPDSGPGTGPGSDHGGEPGPESESEPGRGSGGTPAVAGTTETGQSGSPGSGGKPGDGDAPVRKDGGTVARETVRITDDVGEIFGVDEREYDLVTDDVVQLPAENARPLVERGAAERLD
ncbi:hypothetical protein [Salinirussus salinus]|jgi:DNA replication factor GINS|uniref:hypothetical protein n=1 Tax=Salinirussus salinus TaxID=1198300 RepID=UPI0013590607|nr:hypothetical protein [Salinirussus salinus]